MISIKDLSVKYIENICKKALFYETKMDDIYNDTYSNKILVNIFFEPSTRTMISFDTAMYKLGGKVINFHKDYLRRKLRGFLQKNIVFMLTLDLQHYI